MELVTKDTAADLATLQKMNDVRIMKQGNNSAAIAFARDVKQSLLFQYDWAELLFAAPLCLSLMGSCYVAATSPDAQGMSLSDAKSKVTGSKLKFDNLRACLVHVSDTGRFAFLEAEKQMSLISSTSVSISENLTKIGSNLGRLPAPDAKMNLNKQLEAVKSDSDRCLKCATDIEDKFKDWLELVCELHQVTLAKEESTAMVEQANNITLAGVELKAELTKTSVVNAAEAAKTIKENMETTRKVFEKAADKMPSPMEQIGLEFVSSLAHTVTTSISQGLPGLLLGDLLYRNKRRGNDYDDEEEDQLEEKREKKAKTFQKDLNVPGSDDPAYVAAGLVRVSVNLLATQLGVGSKKGIDWEHLSPKVEVGKEPTEGLAFIDAPISFAYSSTQWSEGEPSKRLKGVLEDVLKVIAALKEEVAKDHKIAEDKVKSDSDKVKSWKGVVEKAQATVLDLTTVASSFAGSAPGAAPIIGKTPARSRKAVNNQAGSSVQAAFASAQETLSIAEAAYTSSQTNYRKAVENHSRVEAVLANIKAELKTLQLTNASIKQIKDILTHCIGILIQMKTQITNLVRFFAALSAMVEHVVKSSVRDFLDQIDTAKTCLIGNISLSDLTRQELYTTTLMCQAYFSLFSTIANMYIKINVDHIAPGIALCDEMSKTTDNPGALSERMIKLDTFTDKAKAAVQHEVNVTREGIINGLDKRVAAVQEVTQALPTLPPAAAQAIANGKATVDQAVDEGFDSYQNPISGAAEDTGVSGSDI